MPKQKQNTIKRGDLVYVGGHIEEVEKVLDPDLGIMLIRGGSYGDCRVLPSYVREYWEMAKREMGIK